MNQERTAPTESLAARSQSPAWLQFVVAHLLVLWLATSVLRFVLALRFPADGVTRVADYARGFLLGSWRDIGVAALLTLPWLGWWALVPRRLFGKPWHRLLFHSVYAFAWCVQVFVFATEYFFFDEFKSRFNTVAVDYLLFPKEVFTNIWESYPVITVTLACVVGGLGASRLAWLAVARRSVWEPVPAGGTRWRSFGVALAITGALLVSLRALPPEASRERLVNELAKNGTLSFLSAAWTRNLDYGAFYPTNASADSFQRARALLAEPGATFFGETHSLARHIAGDPARPKYNVLLFLEESLGSEFFGSLGRIEPTLTPELDRLSTEGLFFVNMYATGNRTVRGFEGVLASFPPLPGDSIVKRDRSEDVETIARVLQRDGYRTLFLYGGRGLFDGMRAFATDNGYERFIEQKDFAHPTFTTIWGVCNEDLYERTLAECRQMNQPDAPFFATVLSVSNHKPYTYPRGRIPEDPELRKRNHAVKYTDWALGQFFAKAKQEPFWTNTLFVVVADHGARVYGSQAIPMHSYEIPLLVLGPAVVKAPARLPQLGSQLDVAPTILGLLGRPYDTLFFGHDLLREPASPGRVLLNHNREIGLGSSNRLVVFSLNKRVEYYEGNPKTGGLHRVETPDPVLRELEQDATALFQTADELYMHRRYALPKSSSASTPAREIR